MRTLPFALRCYLWTTCITLVGLAAAVVIWRICPLILILGMLPLGTLRVSFDAIRQAEQAIKSAEVGAAALRRRGEQLEEVLAAGERLRLQQTQAELLQPVATAARALVGAAVAAAYLPDADDATMLQRVVLAPADTSDAGPTYLSIPATRLHAVEAIDNGRTLLAPLQAHDGALLGLLRLMGVPAAPAYDGHDVLAILATQASIALQNAQSHERALAQASEDGLTGLPNHRTFQTRLEEEVARARRGHHSLALMMVDLDDFRTINNTYGHPAGDATLASVAALLRKTVRASDIAARYGGDEFAVILPETSLDEALEIAGRVHAAIAVLRVMAGGAHISVGTSVGVAALPLHATTREELVHAADRAAYAAKHAGKGRVARPEDAVFALDSDPATLAKQLAHANMATVEALAAAVDAKDPGTHGHSQRVSTYAAVIAQVMCLPASDVARIRMAGLLHDVGKIGVPDAILTKPGRLTTEEFALIRQHPETGERMLASVPFLHEILPAVRHHHERWDGRGYPDRLTGAAIPRDAAILMVADAFDAMTSSRTYRPALPLNEARRRLREGSGTQFDPRIITAFERALADRILVPLSSKTTLALDKTCVA